MEKTLANGKRVVIGGNLTMGEFRRWLRAEAEGDMETVYRFLAKMIERWDYSWDPHDPASFDELTLAEYRMVTQAVAEALRAEAEAKN